MTFGCGCGAGPSDLQRTCEEGASGLDVGLGDGGLGQQRTSEQGGWREGAAALAGRMPRCTVYLHSLCREQNLGLKSFSQYPSPRPLTPQLGETGS